MDIFHTGLGVGGLNPIQWLLGVGLFMEGLPYQQFQLSLSGPNFFTRSLPVLRWVSSLFQSFLGCFSSYSTWLASSKFFLAMLFVFWFLCFCILICIFVLLFVFWSSKVGPPVWPWGGCSAPFWNPQLDQVLNIAVCVCVCVCWLK